ncbi:transcription factor mef2A-like isoform X2 [Rhagoletis pomonella]|uniref:transcription factor mef2A-like isoform X2 n=1 Tax=Rhagoletis pomonella TaxID=28610 RepID=UPI001784C4F2|nr:transcription factor mef2A-like isoform X2 [Rhagoletis pomonella]
MVLTNFECWAHGGGAVVGSDGFALDSRHVDMFNTRMVQQRLNNATGIAAVSHISSNGYYGFSYVNAAHESADDNSHNNNNNNDNINNTNINLNNNNNNNNRCVPNANNVNGMPLIHHNNNHSSSMNVSAISVDAGFPAAAAAAATFGTQRCKKRYFASDDDYANCDLLNGCDSGVGADGRDVCVAAAAKRCRFDDDYAAAQYCNDFFSLPSTQIGTQSCLMDTEDTQQLQQQQQQPQVDVNMDAANLTNQTINNATSNIHFITQQQQQQQHAEQQQQQQVINTAQSPPVVVYQQQHNYQGVEEGQGGSARHQDCDNTFLEYTKTNRFNNALEKKLQLLA